MTNTIVMPKAQNFHEGVEEYLQELLGDKAYAAVLAATQVTSFKVPEVHDLLSYEVAKKSIAKQLAGISKQKQFYPKTSALTCTSSSKGEHTSVYDIIQRISATDLQSTLLLGVAGMLTEATRRSKYEELQGAERRLQRIAGDVTATARVELEKLVHLLRPLLMLRAMPVYEGSEGWGRLERYIQRHREALMDLDTTSLGPILPRILPSDANLAKLTTALQALSGTDYKAKVQFIQDKAILGADAALMLPSGSISLTSKDSYLKAMAQDGAITWFLNTAGNGGYQDRNTLDYDGVETRNVTTEANALLELLLG